MSNNLKTIKLNLYKLFWKYPELKNKNYNYVYMLYCKEYYANLLKTFELSPQFWENMPAMESISRCKRKLAKTDVLFRPDITEVIIHRKNQTNEILESIKD